jgi:hypothetical protein
MKKFAILIAIPTDSYKQTQIRIDASHVQDHYQDKHPEQTTREDEQVLRFQSLNSTVLPIPLLMLYVFIPQNTKEERT